MSFYSIAPFIKEYYPQYYSIERYPADQCVTIHKVKEDWGIFCNFAPAPLVVNGITFRNSEQLFQLMKFRDREAVLVVYCSNQPKMTAKHWEKTSRREDWGSMILDAMKFCLQTKWEQCEEFRKALSDSKGRYIVEDQTSFPKKSPDAWGVKLVGNEYVGPNVLGRLLMELRDKGQLEYTLPEDALAFTEFLTKE
jgi:ribA/ribD-fused uncharacterized protein